MYGSFNINAYNRAETASQTGTYIALVVGRIPDPAQGPFVADTGRGNSKPAETSYSLTSWLWHVESGSYGVLKAWHNRDAVNMGFADGHASNTPVKGLNDIAYNGYDGKTYRQITYVNSNNEPTVFTLTAP